MPSIAAIVLDKYNGVQAAYVPTPGVHQIKNEDLARVGLTQEQLDLKEALRNELKTGVHRIEYNKVDGTPAVMECTLDPRFMPINESTAAAKPYNPLQHPMHILRVYATDRSGWRSFSVLNVQSIEPA